MSGYYKKIMTIVKPTVLSVEKSFTIQIQESRYREVSRLTGC